MQGVCRAAGPHQEAGASLGHMGSREEMGSAEMVVSRTGCMPSSPGLGAGPWGLGSRAVLCSWPEVGALVEGTSAH